MRMIVSLHNYRSGVVSLCIQKRFAEHEINFISSGREDRVTSDIDFLQTREGCTCRVAIKDFPPPEFRLCEELGKYL